MYQRDVYHLVTVDGGKADADAIVKTFSEIAAGDLACDVKFLNYYHEVPVSYGAEICSVEAGNVECSVHENQALIISHDNSTLIKSRHFPNGLGVHCYATYVNVSKRIVVLSRFAYAQIRAERRDAVRVKVNTPMSVTCSFDAAKVTGTLVDISGNGLSVASSTIPPIDSNQPVLLSFKLMNNEITIPGEFIRAVAKEQVGHLAMFQIKPDMKNETIIGQFIYKRQIEILQSLRDGVITA